MAERPPPPPWGALLTEALAGAQLSARKAARRAGISEGRWRQIASGYQIVSPGVYAPVHGPADTLARMAAAVGVTPAQLTDVGRPDAAKVLAGHETDASHEQMLQRVREMNPEQARELLAAIADALGVQVPAAGGEPEERRYGT
jgi:transcriptional regulator with XRE-family HTH domain